MLQIRSTGTGRQVQELRSQKAGALRLPSLSSFFGTLWALDGEVVEVRVSSCSD